MKTRIRYGGSGDYYAEYKPWWCPFWLSIRNDCSSYGNELVAMQTILDFLIKEEICPPKIYSHIRFFR